MEHSGNIQVAFMEHSGNIQVAFMEHSGNIQVAFMEHSGNIPVAFMEHTRSELAGLGVFAPPGRGPTTVRLTSANPQTGKVHASWSRVCPRSRVLSDPSNYMERAIAFKGETFRITCTSQIALPLVIAPFEMISPFKA
jgi:hypothetical protein